MTPEQKAAIPEELKLRKQWVWFKVYPSHTDAAGKFHKGKKMPFSANGQPASSTDPSTWGFFEDVVDMGLPAYCFTAEDPYVFIDLDAIIRGEDETDEEFLKRKEGADTFKAQIIKLFPGYLEISNSGEGTHIIGKGVVGPGRKRGFIEVYDRGRFCIFTGNGSGIILEFDPEQLRSMLSSMPTKESLGVVDDLPQVDDDDVVLARMARHGERAQMLVSGRGRELGYPSDSELHHAFISLTAEETGNFEQTNRLYEESGYKSEKKKPKDYVQRSFLPVRARIQQEKEFRETFIASIVASKQNGNGHHPSESTPVTEPVPETKSSPASAPVKEEPVVEIPKPKMKSKIHPSLRPTDLGENDVGARMLSSLPQGLIRDLAFGFYAESVYPVAEVSTVAALATFALAAQRSFKVNGECALNIYAIVLAASSVGKSTLVSGIPRIVAKCGAESLDYWSGEIRSEAGVAKQLTQAPKTLMMVQECVPWMKAMTDANASGWQQSASSAFTQLYSAGTSVYRAPRTGRSDTDDLKLIQRPCFSIIGEAQPGPFWKAIKATGVTTGFLPRFIIWEVSNQSIQIAKQKPSPIPEGVKRELSELLKLTVDNDVRNGPDGDFGMIEFDSPATEKVFDEYCEKWRLRLKTTDQHDDGVDTSIYGKMGENVLRVAGLLAASANWRSKFPQLKMEHLQWAMDLINHCSATTVENLGNSSGENTAFERHKAVMKEINRIRPLSYEERLANKSLHRFFVNPFYAQHPNVLPVSMLRFFCGKLACFQECRSDAAFDGILMQLVNDGDIADLKTKEVMFTDHGIRSKCILVE